MPGGRPSEYDPAFCEHVIELAKEGAGKAEIAAELGINRKTLDNWAEKYPEFLAAVTCARDSSAGWWEKQGRLGIWSKEFNSNAYSLQVRNRFPEDWSDRQQVTGADNKPLIPEDSSTRDLAKAILSVLARGVNDEG